MRPRQTPTPTPPPPTPTRARGALLAGGLVLLAAGVALVAWALASSAGLVGRNDDPVMADPTATTTAAGAAATVEYRLEPAQGDPLTVRLEVADGRVVSVAEMTPCKADPCPSYAPAGPYRYAVELAAGAFGDAGVGTGDKVVPVDPAALPEPA